MTHRPAADLAEQATLTEVAARLGVSMQVIQRQERRALRRIWRVQVQPHGPSGRPALPSRP